MQTGAASHGRLRVEGPFLLYDSNAHRSNREKQMRTLVTGLLCFTAGVALAWMFAQGTFGNFIQVNLHTDVIAYESLIEHTDAGNVQVVRDWLVHRLCANPDLLQQNTESWLIPYDASIDRALNGDLPAGSHLMSHPNELW